MRSLRTHAVTTNTDAGELCVEAQVMYDYRRMTQAERQAIVAERRSRHFPWHKPPHRDLGEGWFLITAATFEHRPHFTAPTELRALVQRLLEALAGAALPVAGWVVFPNHYHALVQTSALATVGRALGAVHGRSALYANRRDHTPARQVWYKFSDRKVRSNRHFWACLHYIVFNPVKHRYVGAMGDWPWSCYAELVDEHGEAWLDDLCRSYPLGDFGKGWDD
jgi:putative transposase